jgi:lysophospholipase L1-like esterase
LRNKSVTWFYQVNKDLISLITKKGGCMKKWLVGTMVVLMSVLGGCGDNHDSQEKVVLINLGDSYANGVQSGSGNVNQYTQVNSYPQIIADQMTEAVDLVWGNPLVDMDKQRIDDTFYPYNVGVDGATVQSLLTETSDDWDYINELMKPIPAHTGTAVTQLEAAEYVAGLHSNKTKKIITLLIGGNDVLGTVNAGGGTQLTAFHINAFFNDTDVQGNPLGAGHDLASVTANLTTIIDRLKAIPNSHIFISSLPSVAGIAGLFNKNDIEKMAVYDNPQVTALADEEYMGFVPVGGFGVLPGLSGALAADDATLNATIAGTLAAGGNDAFSLTAAEKAIIEARTNAINDHIESLVASNDNVYLVDLVSFFNRVIAGEVVIDGHEISRSYGGGLFSMDGFHPSNTGYALIGNVFIQTINETGIIDPIPLADLSAIFANDPYQDRDSDGYIPGPLDLSIVDMTFASFLDCDDEDNAVSAPFPVDGMTGICD